MDRRSTLAGRLLDYIRTLNGMSASAFFTSVLALRRHQIHARQPRKFLPGIAVSLPLHASLLREAAYFASHAAAAFGSYGSSFFHLHDPRPFSSLSLLDRLRPIFRPEDSAYASLAGLPTRDAVIMRGGGSGIFIHTEPRWFLSIDERARSIVLCVRGTMSLGDAVTDALGTNEKFAWGVAHAGVGEAARSIWAKAKPVVEREMASRGPDWRFVTTGHSLGGATALLIVVLGMYESGLSGIPWLGNRRVDAIAFAPPPIYAGPPLPLLPHICLTTFIHEWDSVSRLSLTSLHELGRACHALAQVTSWNQRLMGGATGPLSKEEIESIASVEPQWIRTWAPDESSTSSASTSIPLSFPSTAATTTTTTTTSPPPKPISLSIPGDIYSWREPKSLTESGGGDTGTGTTAEEAEADREEEAAVAEAAVETRDDDLKPTESTSSSNASHASPSTTPLSTLAETFSFISHAELFTTRITDGLRSATSHAVSILTTGGGRVTDNIASLPPSSPSTPLNNLNNTLSNGPLLTRNKHDDGEMQSLPLFSLRHHVPHRYLFGLKALAAHAKVLEDEIAERLAFTRAIENQRASAVIGSAKESGNDASGGGSGDTRKSVAEESDASGGGGGGGGGSGGTRKSVAEESDAGGGVDDTRRSGAATES